MINIKKIFILVALRTFVNSNLSILTSLTTFGGYTYFRGPLDVETLFSSTKLIEEVATPMINIPQCITDLESLKISLNRIQDFLIVKEDMETTKNDSKNEENDKDKKIEDKNENENKKSNN